LGAEVPLERFADRQRLAAGNIEATAGEMVGLVQGEGKGTGDDRHPGRENPAPSPAQHSRKSIHSIAHWLVGQPFAPGALGL
jgi:hypothetical protein